MAGPNIAVLDIETAPMLSHHWRTWDENIPAENVVEDWSILGFAWQKLEGRRVWWHQTGGRGRAKVRKDRNVCRELWRVLDWADIVIAQNGKKFDVPKIKARLLLMGFKPPSPFRVIDTRLEAKRFGVTYTNLGYLSRNLTKTPKSDHPKYHGIQLWIACLNDIADAWREMRKYCIRDVVAAKGVYLKVRPWMPNHPNVNTYAEREEARCPKCGSAKLQSRGYDVTQVGKFHRLKCMRCGGWSRGRRTTNRATSKFLLAN